MISSVRVLSFAERPVCTGNLYGKLFRPFPFYPETDKYGLKLHLFFLLSLTFSLVDALKVNELSGDENGPDVSAFEMSGNDDFQPESDCSYYTDLEHFLCDTLKSTQRLRLRCSCHSLLNFGSIHFGFGSISGFLEK